MAWSEASIIRAIGRQVLQRKCILLVDNCQWTGHECDVLGVTQDMRTIDIEVKISRADLKADAKKDKWWHRRRNWLFQSSAYLDGQHGAPAPDMLREWPPKVWKHYYAMPLEIWQQALFDSLPSPSSGVLLLTERGGTVHVHCERRAKPDKDARVLTAAEAVDIARLANLRMWDAYCREAA